MVNTAHKTVVTEDTQEEDTVPKVMLLVAVVVDSSARSLTILLKEVKSSCVLVPVEELVTDKVVLAAVKPAEKAVVTAVTLVPNLQEAQVLLVLMDHNLLEETAILVDSKTPDLMTVLVEVLDTSVVKVVVTTLEAAAAMGREAAEESAWARAPRLAPAAALSRRATCCDASARSLG